MTAREQIAIASFHSHGAVGLDQSQACDMAIAMLMANPNAVVMISRVAGKFSVTVHVPTDEKVN